jgi:hypothetical protein
MCNSNKQPSIKTHAQMCYIKTATILNNIKQLDSYWVNFSINFAIEAFIIQFNDLII